jgi:hypothetical protein
VLFVDNLRRGEKSIILPNKVRLFLGVNSDILPAAKDEDYSAAFSSSNLL